MIAALLFFFFSLLYHLSRAKTFSYDGLCYALDVAYAPPGNWFHPYHLLYSALAKLMETLLHAVVPSISAIAVMQELNSWAASGAVALLYLVVAEAWGKKSGVWAALLFGFSTAFWNEAIDSGCYACASLAAVVVLRQLLRSDGWRSGIVCGLAVLFHYMLFLTAPAFLVLQRGSKKIRWLAAFLLCIGLGYGVVIALFHASWPEARSWFFGLALAPTASHGLMWWRWGLMQNAIDAWRSSIWSLLPHHHGSLVVGLVMAGWTLFWSVSRSEIPTRERIALWAWIGVMLGFQAFYNPGAERFRLLWLPVFLYLAAGAWRRTWSTPLGASAWALLLALNVGVTYRDSIRSRLVSRTDAPRVAWLLNTLHQKDFFLFLGAEGESILNVYMAYFGHAISGRSLYGYYFDHLDGNSTELNTRLRDVQAMGGQVWMETALADPKRRRRFNLELGLPPETLNKALGEWVVVETRTGPDGYSVSRVVNTTNR